MKFNPGNQANAPVWNAMLFDAIRITNAAIENRFRNRVRPAIRRDYEGFLKTYLDLTAEEINHAF